MLNCRVLIAALPIVLLIGCAGTPSLTGQPQTPRPSALASPSPSPAASATAQVTAAPTGGVDLLIGGDEFTQQGGCGDAFLWAANADGTLAVTVEWQGAAEEAWAKQGLNETVDLPSAEAKVTLMAGRELTSVFCNDVLSPDAGADSEAPAVAGTVHLVIQPNPNQGRPASLADLTVRDLTFDVIAGTEEETWGVDQIEWTGVSIGWFAG